MDAAAETARDHAGLNASDVRITKNELDDDGLVEYAIEFLPV